jgi:coenzyme F420-0:L-glutamate ligase/coenzyme F420-1:gamma-L-glutamate ligase
MNVVPPAEVHAIPLPGLPEIQSGDDLGATVAGAATSAGLELDGCVLAISQKVVSKAEGRVVELGSVAAGEAARGLAGRTGRDPRLCELILSESRELIRVDEQRGIVIVETQHGFICANAGIDSSNSSGPESVVLLPEDPDASARRIRDEVERQSGARPAVVVSDSFGRAWRLGQGEVAIGCAGIDPLDDWRGLTDSDGRELAATVIAVADQIAGAADLARSKTSRTPAVLVRGVERFVIEGDGPGCVAQLRPAAEDLFR